jgi:hypothetical protein
MSQPYPQNFLSTDDRRPFSEKTTAPPTPATLVIAGDIYDGDWQSYETGLSIFREPIYYAA